MYNHALSTHRIALRKFRTLHKPEAHESNCHHTIHSTACKQEVNKPPRNSNTYLYCCNSNQVHYCHLIKKLQLMSYCISLVLDGQIYFLVHYPTRNLQRRLANVGEFSVIFCNYLCMVHNTKFTLATC